MLGQGRPYDRIPHIFSDQYDSQLAYYGFHTDPPTAIRGALDTGALLAFWQDAAGRVVAAAELNLYAGGHGHGHGHGDDDHHAHGHDHGDDAAHDHGDDHTLRPFTRPRGSRAAIADPRADARRDRAPNRRESPVVRPDRGPSRNRPRIRLSAHEPAP
jgi:hypothetical protein